MNNKEHIYYVKGMHCASCEILIEKKILEIPNVKSAEASTDSGRVVVEYEGEKPKAENLNDIFRKDNYTFFENEYVQNKSSDSHSSKDLTKEKNVSNKNSANPVLVAFNVAIVIVIAFLILDRAGISGILNVNSSSSLITFFIFGLLAGLSSCAALVGGIVLSMSKQWHDLYSSEQSYYKKIQPHIMFNVGRILSYAILGGVLGLVGGRLSISLGFTAFLVIAISFLMIILGLQMIGVAGLRKFQFSMPKFVTRRIANESNFKSKHMPFVMGALTFFLPCGFTITAQTIALLSGSAVQGALIMGVFALGTLPMLLLIGFSSVKLFSKPHLSAMFSKVAGFLVIFFAIFTLVNQMNVLGFSLNGSLTLNQNENQNVSGLAPVIDGVQVVKMTVLASNYDPNYFKVKVGIPVRWEITSSGQPSCASGSVIARGLVDTIYLNPNAGQVTVKEFVPQKIGQYLFSCSMGMIRGTIDVVN